MINNKNLLHQLVWIIKEEKKFYDNYNSYDNNSYTNNSYTNNSYDNYNILINYVNYIETLYTIIQSIK